MFYDINDLDDSISNSVVLGEVEDFEMNIYIVQSSINPTETSYYNFKTYNLLLNSRIPCYIDVGLHLFVVSSKNSPVPTPIIFSYHSLIEKFIIDLTNSQHRRILLKAYKNVIHRILGINGFINIKNTLISFEHEPREKFKISFKIKPFLTSIFQIGLLINPDLYFDQIFTESLEPLTHILTENLTQSRVYLSPSGTIGTLTGNVVKTFDIEQINKLKNYWKEHYFLPKYFLDSSENQPTFVEVNFDNSKNDFHPPLWYPLCFVFNIKCLKNIGVNISHEHLPSDKKSKNNVSNSVMNQIYNKEIKNMSGYNSMKNKTKIFTPPKLMRSKFIPRIHEFMQSITCKRAASPAKVIHFDDDYDLTYSPNDENINKYNKDDYFSNFKIEYSSDDFEQLWVRPNDMFETTIAKYSSCYTENKISLNIPNFTVFQNNKVNTSLENRFPNAYSPLNLKYPDVLKICPKYKKRLCENSRMNLSITKNNIETDPDPPLLFNYNIIYPFRNESKSTKFSTFYLNSLFSIIQNTSITFFIQNKHLDFCELCLILRNIKYLIFPLFKEHKEYKEEMSETNLLNHSLSLNKSELIYHFSSSPPIVLFRKETYPLEVDLNHYKFNENSNLKPYGDDSNANIITIFPNFDFHLINNIVRQTIVYYNDYHLGSLNLLLELPIEESHHDESLYEENYRTNITRHLKMEIDKLNRRKERKSDEGGLDSITTIFLVFYYDKKILNYDKKFWIRKNIEYKSIIDSIIDKSEGIRLSYNQYKMLLIPYQIFNMHSNCLSPCMDIMELSKWISFSCYERITGIPSSKSLYKKPRLVIKTKEEIDNSLRDFHSNISNSSQNISWIQKPIYILKKTFAHIHTSKSNSWDSFLYHVISDFMFCSFGYELTNDDHIWIWSILSDSYGKILKYKCFMISALTETESECQSKCADICSSVIGVIVSYCNSILNFLSISYDLILFPCNKEFLFPDIPLNTPSRASFPLDSHLDVLHTTANGYSPLGSNNLAYLNILSSFQYKSVSIWSVDNTFINLSTINKNTMNVDQKNIYGILSFPKKQHINLPYAYITIGDNNENSHLRYFNGYIFRMEYKHENSSETTELEENLTFFNRVMKILTDMIWLNNSLVLSEISFCNLCPFLQQFLYMKKILQSSFCYTRDEK